MIRKGAETYPWSLLLFRFFYLLFSFLVPFLFPIFLESSYKKQPPKALQDFISVAKAIKNKRMRQKTKECAIFLSQFNYYL